MNSLPSPGQANTLSVTTAPETSSAASSSDDGDERQERRAQHVPQEDAPLRHPARARAGDERLTRAPRSSTRAGSVSTPPRACRRAPCAGSMRCCSAIDDAAVAGRHAPGRRQPAERTPRTRSCSTRPNQNAGIARPGRRRGAHRRGPAIALASAAAQVPARQVATSATRRATRGQLERRRRALQHAHRAPAGRRSCCSPSRRARMRQAMRTYCTPQRPVEPQRPPQPLDVLGPHAGIREEHRRRAARRRVDQRKTTTETMSSSGTAWPGGGDGKQRTACRAGSHRSAF